MKFLSVTVWLVLAAYLAFQFHSVRHAEPTGECQAYDRLGRGIGCESEDLGDL